MRSSDSFPKLLIIPLLIAAVVLVLPACGRQDSPTAPGESASVTRDNDSLFGSGDTQRWVVRVEDTAVIEQLLADYGLTGEDLADQLHLFTVILPVLPPEMLTDPRVLAFQPDEPVVLSAPQEMLMGFNEGDWDEGDYPAQDALSGLHLARVHSLAQGKGVVVAVLDTGVDLLHPHLTGHIVDDPSPFLPPPMEVANGIDDDGDGQVDEAFGHGTHVAGTIVTMAPQARILPLKVMNDDGAGTSYDLAIGLSHALEAGVQVVNLSLSLSGASEVIAGLLQDLQDAGVEVVAAAGNTGGTVLFPASDPTVVSVAAIAAGGELAPFSAWGEVDLGAPGVQVVSSYPGGGVAMASGTSMAAAVVSGSVALMRGQSEIGPVEPWLPPLWGSAVTVQPAGSLLHGEVAPLAALKLALDARDLPQKQFSILERP